MAIDTMSGTQALDVAAALRAHSEKMASIEVGKDSVTVDLGHLMASDSAPVDSKALKYAHLSRTIVAMGRG